MVFKKSVAMLFLLLGAMMILSSVAIGYKLGLSKRDKLIIEQQEAYISEIENAKKQAQDYEEISQKYYQDYQDAINSKTDSIVERVYIKADCDNVPSDTDGGVGGRDTSGRAELHADVVRRITEVTKQAERNLGGCYAKLNSAHDKIKAHNARIRSSNL